MTRIHATATIDAPADMVFDIVEAPERWPDYVPHVLRALDVRSTDQRLGDTFRLIYKVLGLTFDERMTVTAYQRPRVYGLQVDGRMSGRQDWRLSPDGRQTRLDVDVDYRVPGGPAGRAMDALLLRRVNTRTIDRMLQNLRRMAG